MRTEVLGVKVSQVNKEQAISRIADWIEGKQWHKLVVTLYSEFLVKAWKDREFADLINRADMVTADGVSVLAAVKYEKNKGLINGLKVGGDILTGKIGETVTGVYLFGELLQKASERHWSVFVLGGQNDVYKKVIDKAKQMYPSLRIYGDGGEKEIGMNEREEERIVDKINRYRPDLLFVAYEAVYQYRWLDRYKKKLWARVMMGVGGTFDEFVGDFPETPKWMERMGLKWLWRLWIEPKRWKRIWNAVVVFPWLVWRRS